jgi:hypothetical protein
MISLIQLQDNAQHDPADATEAEGGMVEGTVSSADEVDGLTATMQHLEVCEDASASSHEDPNVGFAATGSKTHTGVDNDSDDEYAQTLLIKAKDAPEDDEPSKFQSFDIVKCPPDHHYTDTTDQV